MEDASDSTTDSADFGPITLGRLQEILGDAVTTAPILISTLSGCNERVKSVSLSVDDDGTDIWLSAPPEAPDDGWYWYTWAANQEVRICYVTDGHAFWRGNRRSAPWGQFVIDEGPWIIAANAPSSMAYIDLSSEEGAAGAD